jgi:hypothetical protein
MSDVNEKLAPHVGDWLLSPSDKKWRVMGISNGVAGHQPIYELARAAPSRVRRNVYLREIANWTRADG